MPYGPESLLVEFCEYVLEPVVSNDQDLVFDAINFAYSTDYLQVTFLH